jgi:hypothetical protein
LLSAKQIPAGQSGQLEAVVKTDGVNGKLEKVVTVITNDPRQPMVTLKVLATVEPEFNLSERMLYFGNVPRGTAVVKELEIRIAADRTVKVLSAESTDDAVKVELKPDPKGHNVKVVATQRADAPEGYHFGNLVVKTSSTYTPELKIPVRGMVAKAGSN